MHDAPVEEFATTTCGKRNPHERAPPVSASGMRIWDVGALCHAVAETLDARFNPVSVRGEISGFSRAPAGIATSR